MSKITNMTTGKPMSLILSFFWPVVCSTLFQQCYSLIDSVVVGKGIGDEALGAVGSTGSIMFFIFGFIMGLSSGISVSISQAFGAGNHDRIRKIVTMGFVSCGTVALSIMILSLICIRPLLILLKTPDNMMADALIYIVIIILGIPLTLLYNCLGQILSALGDSKTPFYAVIIASFVNVILDVLFIMVFNMGVGGAAIATLIAQFFASLLCFAKIRQLPFLKINRSDWTLDFTLILAILRIGVPVAFMNSITAVGTLILQRYVNNLGDAYTSAYTACSKITQFMSQPTTAVGMTMNTYCGQNFGARKLSRIKRGIFDGFKLSLFITIIGTALLIGIPKQLSMLMLSNPVNIQLSSDYLVINGIMLWALSFLFLVRSSCQGMGFTFVPMLSGILELVARVVVVVIFIDAFKFNAVAMAGTAAWFGALVMNGVYLFYLIKKYSKRFNAEDNIEVGTV